MQRMPGVQSNINNRISWMLTGSPGQCVKDYQYMYLYAHLNSVKLKPSVFLCIGRWQVGLWEDANPRKLKIRTRYGIAYCQEFVYNLKCSSVVDSTEFVVRRLV